MVRSAGRGVRKPSRSLSSASPFNSEAKSRAILVFIESVTVECVVAGHLSRRLDAWPCENDFGELFGAVFETNGQSRIPT